MYYYEWQTGTASWHGFKWVTQNETTQMCNEYWEASEGSYYQTQYQCGGNTGKCHSIPGGTIKTEFHAARPLMARIK